MEQQNTDQVLDREAFLSAARGVKRPFKNLKVQGLGLVRIQGLNVGERTKFEIGVAQGRNGKQDLREIREKLLQQCLVDVSGRRLLPEDGDRAILSALPAAVAEPMFDLARDLSGMTDKDLEELGNA